MRKYIFAHPWLLTFASIFGIAVQGLFVLSSMLYMRIIDTITEGDSSRFVSLIGAAVVVVLLNWIGWVVFPRLFTAYDLRSAQTLKRDVFESVMNTSLSDFKRDNSAKYISALNNDIDIIETKYFSTIPGLVRDVGSFLLAIGAMAVINPANAIIAVLMIALPLAAPLLYSKKLSSTQLASSTAAIRLNEKIKDALSGFEVIKTFGVEKNIQQKFARVAHRFMRAKFRSAVTMTDMSALLICMMLIVSFVNYFVAGFFVLRGTITVGAVIALVTLHSGVLDPIHAISEHIASLKAVKELNKRVISIMEQKDTTQRKIKIDTFLDCIKLQNLKFAYKVEKADEKAERTMVLKGINYNFAKGGKYAIVGASGSGKSTLVKLIMGYYDDYEGDLTLDGNSIRNIDRESLYNVISILHQNVFLLDDTLRNNVTLYNNYSEKQYLAAVQKANLAAVEASLPNGSDTILGEGGNTVSGGERQRVSIARAIIRGNEVIILDEATANLDNIIAHDIEKSIIEMEGVTCIFVTHRYSKDILEKCDGILVMKDGTLFEQGTFKELIESKGYFYSLYNISG